MATSVHFCDVELHEELGNDSYSIVHKAELLFPHRTIALKQYSKICIVSEENIIEAYSKLLYVNHENILQFFGTSMSPSNFPSLLMEYADCGTLHEQIYGTGVQKYTSSIALNWMYQCARGIEFLHAMQPLPIVHYNLKPTNLFLTKNLRQLKIGELAIKPEQLRKLSSIAYMAPEGVHNQLHRDKYDVYSFGMVFWEVLTRRKPFCWLYEYLTFIFLKLGIMFIRSCCRPSFDQLPKDLSSSNIGSLIECCWDYDPQKRPNMEKVAIDIQNCMRSLMDSNITFEISDMELGEAIGNGSYGVVFKGQRLGISYAVKQFHLQLKDAKKDIEKEVKYLSQVDHRNIIKLFGTMVSEELKTTMIVMEFADCGTLYNYLHKYGEGKRSYSIEEARNWMYQLAQGIEYLHDLKPRPIIHRDIKTKNLLLTNNYQTLKIADFGTVTEQATIMTASIVGTPEYMAPEVLKGREYTTKIDVYSFGIVLWEVMSQKKPFYHLGNNEPLAIMNLISKGERPPIEDVKDYPNRKKLTKIIQNCWDKYPKKRLSMKDVIPKLFKNT